MREIKFRAWDNTHQFMEELSYPWAIMDGEVFQITDQKRWNNVILMQYTGLKDKNGTEIYEGDILGWKGEGYNMHKVFWSEEEASFRTISLVEPSAKLKNTLASILSPISDIEVIGNIYENPKLIKENG